MKKTTNEDTTVNKTTITQAIPQAAIEIPEEIVPDIVPEESKNLIPEESSDSIEENIGLTKPIDPSTAELWTRVNYIQRKVTMVETGENIDISKESTQVLYIGSTENPLELVECFTGLDKPYNGIKVTLKNPFGEYDPKNVYHAQRTDRFPLYNQITNSVAPVSIEIIDKDGNTYTGSDYSILINHNNQHANKSLAIVLDVISITKLNRIETSALISEENQRIVARNEAIMSQIQKESEHNNLHNLIQDKNQQVRDQEQTDGTELSVSK